MARGIMLVLVLVCAFMYYITFTNGCVVSTTVDHVMTNLNCSSYVLCTFNYTTLPSFNASCTKRDLQRGDIDITISGPGNITIFMDSPALTPINLRLRAANSAEVEYIIGPMINGTFLGGVAFTANDTASLSVTLPLNQVIKCINGSLNVNNATLNLTGSPSKLNCPINVNSGSIYFDHGSANSNLQANGAANLYMASSIAGTVTLSGTSALYLDDKQTTIGSLVMTPNSSLMLCNVTVGDQYKYFLSVSNSFHRDGSVNVNFFPPLPSYSMPFVFAIHTGGADGLFTSIHGNSFDESYNALTLTYTPVATHIRYTANSTSSSSTSTSSLPTTTSSTATSSSSTTSSSSISTTTRKSDSSNVSANLVVLVLLFAALLI